MERNLLIKQSPDHSFWWSCRWSLALITFFGTLITYTQRISLSVVIISMSNVTRDTYSKYSNVSECPLIDTNVTATSTGEFDWPLDVQDRILGSFYYGYLLTQIPGGYLSERYGGKWFLGGGVLGSSVLSLLAPTAARIGSSLFIALRVGQGILLGLLFPSMQNIWSVWAPKLERSFLISFTYAGSHLGTVISLPIAGFLASSSFGGWPSVFYLFGGLGCVWFIFWVFLMYNSPAEHPRISQEEKMYIENNNGNTVYPSSFPWRDIATSLPAWAVLIAHFSSHVGFYIFVSSLPLYFSHILHMRLAQNGVLSALPFLGMFTVIILFGRLSDYVISHKYLSTKNTRKTLVTMGFCGSGILMFSITYSGCSIPLTSTLVILTVTVLGISNSGFLVNYVDIAPLYAGTLTGIANTIGTTAGFLEPEIVTLLTANHETRDRWQYVFTIAAATNIFGALFYLVFGDGELQPWAKNS